MDNINNITANIPKSKIANNVKTIDTNITKVSSVNVAQDYSNMYGATVLSNRTEKRGALDSIKTKHQQTFGVGINTKRRTKPFIVN